jgi:hypothetical protein
VDRLPGFFDVAGFAALVMVDEFGLLTRGELLERLDGLVGADKSLTAFFNLADQCRAAPVDVVELSRELRGVEPARGTGVDVDIGAAAPQRPQFFDLSVALGFGAAAIGKQGVVAPQDFGQPLLPHVALVPPQLQQGLEFE